MKPARLREIIRRYGDAGTLLAGAYFAGHHLWTKRRPFLLLALVTVLGVGYVLWGIEIAPAPLPQHLVGTRLSSPAVPVIPSTPYVYRPQRSLLAHSKAVCTLDKYYCSHFWISPARLLLVTSTRPDRYYHNDLESWTGKADILDWLPQRRHRLVGLTRLFHQMHAAPYRFETSPDGKWLKWINNKTLDGWPFPAVARWDGSGFQQWSQDKFSRTYWLDDRRWVEEETRNEEEAGPNYITIHDAKRQTAFKMLVNSKQGQRIIRSHPYVREEDFDTDWKQKKLAPQVTIFTRTSFPHRMEHTIQMPKGAEVETVIVSPKTHRVLYILRFHRTAKPRRHQPEHGVYDLWTSRLNGKGLKQLGHIEAGEHNYSEDEEPVSAKTMTSLEWLPDGKHFSFIYNGKLYLSSVD